MAFYIILMSLSQTAEEQSFFFFTAIVEDLELPVRQGVTGLGGTDFSSPSITSCNVLEFT